MQIILTHEHADFDAVASLVGLARLLPDAVPVLPQEVNDNVADFLTLFGRELPLRRRDELPRQRVAHVWLVDTRRVQAVRGMVPETTRSVIDHHVDADEGPVDYLELDVQAVGATSTMIAERLANAGVTPSEIEASLLLLGIYEDTGSLTYAGTTPRDLRAAAWLLVCGADLGLQAQFMRHTLSAAGQELYRQLLDGIEIVDVKGHQIAIAVAAAHGFDEEIATIATKMIDLLEPAALFMLVDVGSHVQLVARRLSDGIDVGRVAEALGGGGHPRAAAAVIRHTSLATAREALLAELPAAVHAATRVADVMSYGPVRTLAPDMSVGDALAFARRYGHEGYPVVEGDEVLSVLTRRDLDRAMHHHMARMPVRRLLSGPVPAVGPEDSVESLQHLMMEHDLGQVPVTEDGRIVGIVTRTDLLELWSQRMEAGGRRRRGRLNVSSALVAALPPTQLEAVRQIAGVAADRGERAYLVGGLPRDLVLARQPGPDTDVVVVGDAPALASEVARRHGGRVTAHRRFGTAKWVRDGEAIDLSSARSEYYREPTALPSVVRGSLRSDLRRRDFTINTLAVDLHPERFGQVIDLFHGLADGEARLIRVLHSLSFVEDPTRILRAVRFETRLQFAMETRTAELAPEAAPLLQRVSGARIRNEMVQLFREPDPAGALSRLQALGALEPIYSGLTDGGPRLPLLLDTLGPAWAFWRAIAIAQGLRPHPGAVHRMALWLAEHDEAGIHAAARLRLTRRHADMVAEIVSLSRSPGVLAAPDAAPSAVYRALTAQKPDIREFATRLSLERSEIGGAELADMGVPPGPLYGEVLRSVLDARLDGAVSTRDEELALARELVDRGSSSAGTDG
jgi:tRNA nucleotidyltransferase (CCA-adding enzyme)